MFQGDLTRDALAQILLCYIGTAADIIEFFDSFKVCYLLPNLTSKKYNLNQDPKVNTNRILCTAVMCIWSSSLLQFAIVIPPSKVKIHVQNIS